jgi:CheY-like chemotaxis protein
MMQLQQLGGLAGRSFAAAPTHYPALIGLQVFVVEDEPAVAILLEDMLAEFGCVLAGQAATVTEALSAAKATDEIDGAILDVNLGGEKVFPVADLLVRRGVPIVFSTGYGPADILRRYPQSRLLHKPYPPEALARVLSDFVR